jgi:hypothetical protein
VDDAKKTAKLPASEQREGVQGAGYLWAELRWWLRRAARGTRKKSRCMDVTGDSPTQHRSPRDEQIMSSN